MLYQKFHPSSLKSATTIMLLILENTMHIAC
ncbi:hypothetical protein T03_11097 [Trichinella britovi]|uniref:Uncharacterized protein n=1 Tax=Trichinella britovi TaxID=45882 RepID=A0A0V0YU00_TRIBR|nr:hypothetical protein T03_9509 [Trichinella britovi]KRY24676.1 hypothetical protein T03_11097 [Trichinella britovi]